MLFLGQSSVELALKKRGYPTLAEMNANLREMEQASDRKTMADLIAHRSPPGPSGMIPRDYSVAESLPNPAGSGTGWSERPMVNPDAPAHPVPGIDLIDRMVTNADQRERQQAAQPDFMQAAMTMLQVQSQQIAMLGALVLGEVKGPRDAQKSKPKKEAPEDDPADPTLL